MINLLPRNEQKQIYREYLLRIATLVFIGVGLVGTIFVIVLVPSYVRLKAEIASVDAERKTKQAQMTVEDQGQVAEANEFMREIQTLRVSKASSSSVALIEQIIALKPERILLSSFQYDVSTGKTKLTIRGKADRREDLLEFKTRLESKAGFSGIDLPAQTLIKRTDIQFSMDLSGGSVSTAPVTPPPTLTDEPLP